MTVITAPIITLSLTDVPVTPTTGTAAIAMTEAMTIITATAIPEEETTTDTMRAIVRADIITITKDVTDIMTETETVRPSRTGITAITVPKAEILTTVVHRKANI